MPHRSIVTLLCISSLLALGTAGLSSESSGQRKPSASPDVLVLIYSGMGPFDQVSINYSRAVSASLVRKDIAEIKRLTGWLIRNDKVTTESTGAPGGKPTTSSSFEAPPIANTAEGTLPLEPFVTALKRFGLIRAIYLLPSQFQFHGLEDFENDYVKITLKHSGGSHTYEVRVKDGRFNRLGLPLKPVVRVEDQSRGTSRATAFALIVGLAAAGGLVAYVVATLVGKRRTTRSEG